MKNSIRRMKTATASDSSKQRAGSSKKVLMALPLFNDGVKAKEEVNN